MSEQEYDNELDFWELAGKGAFPVSDGQYTASGMTYREYTAAQLMTALMSRDSGVECDVEQYALHMTDRLIAALRKPKQDYEKQVHNIFQWLVNTAEEGGEFENHTDSEYQMLVRIAEKMTEFIPELGL